MDSNCLACGSSHLCQILDFDLQAAANLLSKEAFEPVHREKLALLYCKNCGHAQQEVFFPPEKLFSHYLYQSGTSQTLKSYFDWLAAVIAKGRGSDTHTLELASNDGSFIKALKAQGVSCEGVEPAHNLAQLCHQEGLKVTQGFWPHANVDGPFDSIVAMNVVAHTPNPLEFMQGVQQVIADKGVAYIQTSQVDMFDNFEFDTLYHEHFSFFCPFSMLSLAKRAGFKYGRFAKTKIHGGSLLALLGNDESSLNKAFGALKEGDFYLGELASSKRPDDACAASFSKQAQNTCDTVKISSRLAQKAGYKVVLVGAAAKAITMLQASKVKVDGVIDEARLKSGLYIPGTDLQIKSLSSLEKISEPIFFIIGAWNFYGELCAKIKAHRKLSQNNPSDLVSVYFPSFSIRELA